MLDATTGRPDRAAKVSSGVERRIERPSSRTFCAVVGITSFVVFHEDLLTCKLEPWETRKKPESKLMIE